jgi:hypothetical protein
MGQAVQAVDQSIENRDMMPLRQRLMQLRVSGAEGEQHSMEQRQAMLDKQLQETDLGAKAYSLSQMDDQTLMQELPRTMPQFFEAGKFEGATPEQYRQRLGGIVNYANAKGFLKIPQASKTSLQSKAVQLADGTRAFAGFDPATNTYYEQGTNRAYGAGEVQPIQSEGQKIEVNVPAEKQQSEFGKKLAEKSAEQFAERYSKAESARSSINSTIEAEKLLDSGAITGFGAQFITSFGKALNQMGFSVAEDAISNTEAYLSSQATQVAEIIKAFGAGTGLSDKDREFAEKAAGANVSMSEGSLRYVLDINRRRYRTLISDVNKKLESIPEEYRPFLNPIEMPNVPGFSEQESMQDRIKTLSTFNRGMETADMPFATPEQVRRQLKQEGYDVSKLSNEDITRLLVGGKQPVGNAIKEGSTATNPATGERIVYRNGQWEALQ